MKRFFLIGLCGLLFLSLTAQGQITKPKLSKKGNYFEQLSPEKQLEIKKQAKALRDAMRESTAKSKMKTSCTIPYRSGFETLANSTPSPVDGWFPIDDFSGWLSGTQSKDTVTWGVYPTGDALPNGGYCAAILNEKYPTLIDFDDALVSPVIDFSTGGVGNYCFSYYVKTQTDETWYYYLWDTDANDLYWDDKDNYIPYIFTGYDGANTNWEWTWDYFTVEMENSDLKKWQIIFHANSMEKNGDKARSILIDSVEVQRVYTLTLTANPTTGGTVYLDSNWRGYTVTKDTANYFQGNEAKLYATQATGYTFAGWYNGSTLISANNPYTQTVTSDMALTAKFNPTSSGSYYVTVSAGSGGGVSGSSSGTYASGTTLNVVATPNSGYTFTNWTFNGTVVSTNATYSYTVISAGTLQANFTQNSSSTYYVTVLAGSGGGVSGSSSGTYASGTTLNVVATPNSGYTFTNWTFNGTVVSTNATYSYTVISAGTLQANFTQNSSSTYYVTVLAGSGGSVSGSSSGTYASGATLNVVATPNSGYTFTNWTFNGTVVSTNAYYGHTVTGNGTLVAHFSSNSGGGGGSTNSLSLTAIPSTAGSVMITGLTSLSSTAQANVASGTSVTVIAYPNSGYAFTSWQGTYNNTSIAYTFSMPASSVSLYAMFGTVGIEEENAVDFKAYPNPVNDVLMLLTDAKYDVKITDMSGRVLWTQQVSEGATSIDFSTYQSGIYLIELRNDSQLRTLKVIKQ